MMMPADGGSQPEPIKLQEFVKELGEFAVYSENILASIERDLEGGLSLFSVFSEKMLAIRGTAQQLSLPHIAHIAGLAEEIALKAVLSGQRSQVRKCVHALWDALTTIKFLLEHSENPSSEPEQILLNRLENTLRVLGGARPKVDADEIEAILAAAGQRKI